MNAERILELFVMKPDIHPEYYQIEATCVCGNVVKTGSTMKAIRLDICSGCHPFFTGTQKLIDTEGRVERFNRKYQKAATPAS
jgi:large subunit ribosomal protein L31